MRLFSSACWTRCFQVPLLALAVSVMLALLQLLDPLRLRPEERNVPWNTRLLTARYR